MAYSQRLWIMYIIVFSLNFMTVKELSTKRHFTVQTAKQTNTYILKLS